jgi:hypothetical protein
MQGNGTDHLLVSWDTEVRETLHQDLLKSCSPATPYFQEDGDKMDTVARLQNFQDGERVQEKVTPSL